MSLFPPLRSAGSSSRLTGLYVKPALSHARRRVATSSQSGVNIGTTVQEADKALQDLAKLTAQMKKSGRSVDLTAMSTPVIDRTVDPPYQLSWMFRKGGWTYLKDRLVRFRTTRHFLNDLIKKGVFEKQKGRFLGKLYESIRCLRPTYKAKALVKELQEVYVELNKCQAAGDEIAVRSLATGDAMDLAHKIAKAKRNMEWELVSMNAEPKVMSARVAPLDAENKLELAQVVVRFDSDQMLIMRNQKASERKQQRVVENCIFERHLPMVKGWRLKGTLPVTEPDVAR